MRALGFTAPVVALLCAIGGGTFITQADPVAQSSTAAPAPGVDVAVIHVVAQPGDGYERVARRIAPNCPSSDIERLWRTISVSNGYRTIKADSYGGEVLEVPLSAIPACATPPSSTTPTLRHEPAGVQPGVGPRARRG